jgi:hypothetical protein
VAGFTKVEKGHGLWEVVLKDSGEYLGWILASTGVMKKLGMRYVDNRVHHTPLRDFDCAYYEMPANIYR